MLTILLASLTIFKISGTSIGIYHNYFYGKSPDSALLANKPRQIRSDEWLVNTQMIRAQSMSNYNETNKDIGNGQDMSLILDVPYKSWSSAFKPLNLVFFILPFNIAFALKWWLMGYLLILSCYLLILELLPKKSFFAIFFSSSLVFMPFVQWWYQYITLAPLFLSLLIALVYIRLLRSTTHKMLLLWGVLLTYLVICYAFILYPPFQIACAIPLGFFILGMTLERYSQVPIKNLLKRLGITCISLLSAGFVTLLFLKSKINLITTIQGTAYPGKRSVPSGGYDFLHLASNHLAASFQFTSKANKYVIAAKGILNQSETANFILLIPYLILPGIYLQIKKYRTKEKVDWPLVMLMAGFFVIIIRLFVPYFNQVFKILQLDKVPHNRLLIGLGLLSTLFTILIVRRLDKDNDAALKNKLSAPYALLVFGACASFGYKTYLRFPGFTNTLVVLVYSALVATLVWLLLCNRFKIFSVLFFFTTLSTTVAVHPLYIGTGAATSNKLSTAIQGITKTNPAGKWVTDDLLLENYTAMNGAPSLTGTYSYPQLKLWETISNAKEDDYNRYAHVDFNIDNDLATNNQTKLELIGPDNFKVNLEPCSEFIRNMKVTYIMTEKNIRDSCVSLKQKVEFPAKIINRM